MQVSLALLVSSSALLLPLLPRCCCAAAAKGWKVLKNDATEIVPDYREGSDRGTAREELRPEAASPQPAHHGARNHSHSNANNRAKSGGRSAANTASYSAAELSCRELRSTRYITDGSCRSAKPVRELVCSGQCVPAHLLPNSILRGKWWRGGGGASDYRCIPAHTRTQRVQLQCPNGNTRTYKIRVVTSCKCKRFRPHHNQSEAKEVPKAHRSKKHDRKKNHTPLVGNSY